MRKKIQRLNLKFRSLVSGPRSLVNSSLVNSSGIALLLVLASLALLSGLVVEFAYNANITYNLAFNDKERAQAYYLAQSGIAFSRLIISYDKEAKKLADQASKKLGKNVQIQPLYEMIPVNSAMLRGLADLDAGGAETQPEGAEAAAGEEGGVAAKEVPEDAKSSLSVIDAKGAESFLAFEGDFSAEIKEEDSKLNLNAFFTLTPTQKEYDRLKGTLYHLLVAPEFQGMFEDRFRGAKELAQNIADFIDRDEGVNEAGEERGREGVSAGKNVKMKNGKLLTLEELNLVPGMTEPVFKKLKEYVTIYGKDEKVFLCRASEPLVAAVILSYTDNNPKMEPLKDENQELITKAKEAVLNSCPDAKAMADELDKVLGVEQAETQPTSGPPPTVKVGDTGGPGTGDPAKPATPAFSLSNMIKNQADIFQIVGIGTLNDTEVRLKTVIDASSASSKSWKELYWRVE